jgi:uncharacterized protein
VSKELDLPLRTFGNTAEKVSCIGMGGFHLGKPDLPARDAIRLIHAAVDQGISFLDNSWDYNQGESERRMGDALQQNNSRQRVFLMTKIDGRTKESAAEQIDESLRRLKTDHVDLLQFHEIIRFEDPNRIFAEQGAIEAFEDAKQAGKTRYIGFTGHKDPRIHLYMLEVADEHAFRFDAVQLPINVMDAHFRSFGNLVVPELVKRNIAVLGMKSMGDSVILKSKTVTAMECLHYALKMPTSVVITGIDSPAILAQAIEAARSFQQLSDTHIAAILAKTRPAATHGAWELFKTSNAFDSTAQNVEWLGGKSPHVQEHAPV